MLLIGFTGPAGAGKTTAAHIIGSVYGWSCIGFADPIREAALALCPHWDAWHIDTSAKDQTDPVTGISPRHAMQVIGDHGRAMDPELYVKAMDRRCGDLARRGEVGIAIHDLRTELEADWLRKAGGTVIHIQRKGVLFRKNHPTECGVAGRPGDVVVKNPGTAVDLRAVLDGVLVEIRRRAAA